MARKIWIVLNEGLVHSSIWCSPDYETAIIIEFKKISGDFQKLGEILEFKISKDYKDFNRFWQSIQNLRRFWRMSRNFKDDRITQEISKDFARLEEIVKDFRK